MLYLVYNEYLLNYYMNSTYSIYASKNRFNLKVLQKHIHMCLKINRYGVTQGVTDETIKLFKGSKPFHLGFAKNKLYVLEQNVPNVEIFGGFIVVSF